jgi:ABC-2 type transport system permease protein
MRGTWTIYRRELAGLFLGPLAWILLCLALLLNGFYFTLYLAGTQGDVNATMLLAQGGSRIFWGLLLLVPPLLTMRMISEESRTGTLEFLLTAPVSDLAVVLGKLLAATSLLLLLCCSALVYAGTLAWLGTGPDWGPVLTSLLGATLVSALFSAIGLLCSAGTGTPLLAAFLAFVGNVALLSLPFLPGLLELPDDHLAYRIVAELDVIAHFQSSFLMGVLDSRHVVFFLVWTGFFVLLAARILEARRWRG